MLPSLFERSFNLITNINITELQKLLIILLLKLISQKQTFLNRIEKIQKELKHKSSIDILKFLKEKSDSKFYPSRILNLGLYILISNAQDFKEKNESEKSKIINDIFKDLNLPTNKAEKDIGTYISTLSKMEQAKELIEEQRIKDKIKES